MSYDPFYLPFSDFILSSGNFNLDLSKTCYVIVQINYPRKPDFFDKLFDCTRRDAEQDSAVVNGLFSIIRLAI